MGVEAYDLWRDNPGPLTLRGVGPPYGPEAELITLDKG